jgi:hypothetical protein
MQKCRLCHLDLFRVLAYALNGNTYNATGQPHGKQHLRLKRSTAFPMLSLQFCHQQQWTLCYTHVASRHHGHIALRLT